MNSINLLDAFAGGAAWSWWLAAAHLVTVASLCSLLRSFLAIGRHLPDLQSLRAVGLAVMALAVSMVLALLARVVSLAVEPAQVWSVEVLAWVLMAAESVVAAYSVKQMVPWLGRLITSWMD